MESWEGKYVEVETKSPQEGKEEKAGHQRGAGGIKVIEKTG